MPKCFVGVLLLFLLLAGGALYWPSLNGQFFFDDEVNILAIDALRLGELTLAGLNEAWRSGIAGFGGRPLAQASFALNYYFASSFDPFLFKATNLAIHLLTGVMVFFVLRRLPLSPSASLAATAFWLLHPIQLTSVLYVVQRMTSLEALFLLTGFLLHMLGREQGGRKGFLLLIGAWGICWPLSFFCKETGVLFPLFIFAWEGIVRPAQTGELDRFGRRFALGVFLASLVGVIYALLPAGQWLWTGYGLRSFTLFERMLTEGRVLWFYLWLLLLPRPEAFGLYHDDIVLSKTLFSPWTTLPAWLGLAGLLALIWYMRRRAPLPAFGIAWFLIGHLLESTVLPLEIAHEHRNYLPSLGLAIVVGWLLEQSLRHSDWRRTSGIMGSALFIVYLSMLTGMRAHQYGEAIRRTQIDSQYHRGSARTHYEAGRAMIAGGDIDPATPRYAMIRSHYEQAAELAQDFKHPLLGLIHLNCEAGLPVEQAWLVELSRRLHETPLAPGDRNILASVKDMAVSGSLCLKRVEIEALFSAALTNPTAKPIVRSYILSWLADYRTLVARDLRAAEAALDEALTIAPGNASNRLKRAQLTFLQGQQIQAAEILEGIPDAALTRTERETKALLLGCLEPNPTVQCQGL